jgi:CRISPR/Cas system CMR subunit Cmr4 (Cas7 group RAMP superfamily)
MTVSIPQGESLLRLSARTPGNFGSRGGTATVDRPVGLDVWHDLPFIPFSGVKGVIAGRYGNVWKGGVLNEPRVKKFGSPDHKDSTGRRQGSPSDLIVGDGNLLCFPLRLRDGSIVLVFPALNLLKFLAVLGGHPAPTLSLPADGRFSGPVRGAALPGNPTHQYADPGAPTTSLMAQLLGRDLGPFVLASPAVCRGLWTHACEERTLTAIEHTRKKVRPRSLRRVELVPEGTVFLSHLTNIRGDKVPFLIDSNVQLGAWESTGSGFFLLEAVAAAPVARFAASPDAGGGTSAERPVHLLMREAFEAIERIRDLPEATIVKSILLEFGPRSRTQGWPRTLAFCLAKARLNAPVEKVGLAALGYRWFLETLFAAHRLDLLIYLPRLISGLVPCPPDVEAFSTWLRRYGEGLPSARESGVK